MVYGCKSKHAYVVNYQDENEVYGWSLTTTNPAIELSKRIDGEEGKQYLILRNRLINTSNKLRRSGYTLPKKDIELIKKILNKKRVDGQPRLARTLRQLSTL